MTTPIETMIRRELERETRRGIEHFKPGQHAAIRTGTDEHDVAELSFVDVMGHAWYLLCIKDGGWSVITAVRGGQLTISERPAPPLSERMIAALEAAE